MNFKRWLRHPNALKQFFALLLLGLALGLFASNAILKILGFSLAGSSLLLIVLAAAEHDHLFWKSELEWWEEDDARFEDWKRGL
jgi:hypothetical protein